MHKAVSVLFYFQFIFQCSSVEDDLGKKEVVCIITCRNHRAGDGNCTEGSSCFICSPSQNLE